MQVSWGLWNSRVGGVGFTEQDLLQLPSREEQCFFVGRQKGGRGACNDVEKAAGAFLSLGAQGRGRLPVQTKCPKSNCHHDFVGTAFPILDTQK